MLQLHFEIFKRRGRWIVGQTISVNFDISNTGINPGVLRNVLSETDQGPLCIRVLPGDANSWKGFASRAAVLGHHAVVSVFGQGQFDGFAMLIEDQPDGQSLRRWAQERRSRNGPIPLDEIQTIARAILDALQHAHSASLIHGGLDSECVFISRDSLGDFDIRVAGFGLVPRFIQLSEEVQADTWTTLAPEALDTVGQVKATADLFSFGVLLLEIFTGELYPRNTRLLWREISTDKPNELRKILGEQREDVPDAIWDLIAGLLAADPKARVPSTARDLVRALQKISWEPKEVVKPESPQERAERASRPDVKRNTGASSPSDAAPPEKPATPRIVSVTTVKVDPPRAAAPPAPEKKPPAQPGAATLVDADGPPVTVAITPKRPPVTPKPASPRKAQPAEATLVDADGPSLEAPIAPTPISAKPTSSSTPPPKSPSSRTLVDRTIPQKPRATPPPPPRREEPAAPKPDAESANTLPIGASVSASGVAAGSKATSRVPPEDATEPAARLPLPPSAPPVEKPSSRPPPEPPRDRTVSWNELSDASPPAKGAVDPSEERTLQRITVKTGGDSATASQHGGPPIDPTQKLVDGPGLIDAPIEPLRPLPIVPPAPPQPAPLPAPVPLPTPTQRGIDRTEPVFGLATPDSSFLREYSWVIAGAIVAIALLVWLALALS